MKETAEESSVCSSVFRNGSEQPDAKRFTECWIEIINRLEQEKAQRPGAGETGA